MQGGAGAHSLLFSQVGHLLFNYSHEKKAVPSINGFQSLLYYVCSNPITQLTHQHVHHLPEVSLLCSQSIRYPEFISHSECSYGSPSLKSRPRLEMAKQLISPIHGPVHIFQSIVHSPGFVVSHNRVWHCQPSRYPKSKGTRVWSLQVQSCAL